jgi:tetratricopeptide (TPR) repeat protein
VKRQTIVFVGNCQIGTLARLYKQLVPSEHGDDVIYLASYENATDEQLRTVAEADILVRQVLDFVPKIGDLETSAAVHLVPHVTAAFLWPCTGVQHPKNRGHRYIDASGPYNAELGDSFLNRMILDGVDPDEAVLRYMEADIVALRKVERMAEIVLEKQRSRDVACGYRFADFIEANFRSKPLFRSPNHPEVPLTMQLAGEVFERLGVDSNIIENMQANPPSGLFPATETPIHPSVARHFGLAHINPATRYRFYDEGRYTSAEFAGRYMRYEWNPLLGEGYELARSGDRDSAIEVLTRAIQATPRSAAGHSVLSDLLASKGDLLQAVKVAEEALALEPDNPHYRARAAHIKSQLGHAVAS